MESKDDKSGLVELVRNITVGAGRRGERHPPISLRNISQVTSKKKVVAPKIPQRRAPIKKEQTTSEGNVPLIRTAPRDDSQDRRERGRGRGARNLVQMEGNFLAHGPTAKIKREYERASYSRSSTSERKVVELDPEVIHNLLQSDELYNDDFGDMVPYCLPLPKKSSVPSMKKEKFKNENDIKVVIKSEIYEEENQGNNLEGKFFAGIKKEPFSDDETASEGFIRKEPSSEAETDVEELKRMEDDSTMILLKLPSCLPFSKEPSEAETGKDSKKVNEDEENKSEPKVYSSVQSLPEGFIGKLQIMKTGRKRLVLGSVEFDIMEVPNSESMKEVVSLRMKEDGGDMAVLGNMDKTWVVIPVMHS